MSRERAFPLPLTVASLGLKGWCGLLLSQLAAVDLGTLGQQSDRFGRPTRPEVPEIETCIFRLVLPRRCVPHDVSRQLPVEPRVVVWLGAGTFTKRKEKLVNFARVGVALAPNGCSHIRPSNWLRHPLPCSSFADDAADASILCAAFEQYEQRHCE